MAAKKFRAVLSYRVAMARNCLSLQKKFSITWRACDHMARLVVIWQDFSGPKIRQRSGTVARTQREFDHRASNACALGLKHFHVLEDFLPGLFPGLEMAVMDQFRFEGMEETLSRCVVPTVAFAAHAADVALVLQQHLEAT